jgi:glycosyltransferase involved in cell wall biosynthesis
MSIVPSISVIIPAFNEERHIGRAIRSILNQSISNNNYEVIIVNDASTDRTHYATQLFSDEITVLENNKTLGLPGSLNRGIKIARGKYVVRLDADDYVRSDYLYVLQQFLEDNTDWDAVACDYLLVDNNEQIIRRCNCVKEPIGCGIMFRTDHLIDVGLYDDKFLMHEDKDLRARFIEKHQIHRVAMPLYRYRKHDGNMTNNLKESDFFEGQLNLKHRSN